MLQTFPKLSKFSMCRNAFYFIFYAMFFLFSVFDFGVRCYNAVFRFISFFILSWRCFHLVASFYLFICIVFFFVSLVLLLFACTDESNQAGLLIIIYTLTNVYRLCCMTKKMMSVSVSVYLYASRL